METEEEMSSDLKHDIQLGFNLFKNDKNQINKLKLRTLLFSFVMYKSSSGDINQFIEEQTSPDKEFFTFEEVCKLVNFKIKLAKDKEADEAYNYLSAGKNDQHYITEHDIEKGFEAYAIGTSPDEIKEMMKYMIGNTEDQANKTTSTTGAKLKVNKIQFKNKYNLDLNENLLTDLLTSLNKIWQEREKKQINRLKSQYQSEIMSLRRKLAMKTGYDEFTAAKTISKLKKDLKQTRDDLRDNIVLNNKLRTSPVGIDLVDNALKVASSFQNTKKCLENEIENLKKQLAQKEEKYHGTHQYYNQGCYWMAGRSCEEIELLEKNVEELFSEYEDRVRNSNLLTGQNDLLDYNLRVVNNAVKWFFTTLKELLASIKEKFTNWKYDTQKNLDILKVNAKKTF